MITTEEIKKKHIKLRYEGNLEDNTAYTILSALKEKGFVSGKISYTFNNLMCIGEILYFFEGGKFGKCPSELELKGVLNSVKFVGSYTIRKANKEGSLEILCENQIH